MFQIRKIKPDDIEFVIKITSENGCFEGKLLSNIEYFLICENEGVRCGCGCMVPFKGKGYMNWVTVSKDQRMNNFGGAITKALLNIADLRGIDEVYAPGICGDFLQAMGFEKLNSDTVIYDIRDVLGETKAKEFYRVLLKGYFKPCC